MAERRYVKRERYYTDGNTVRKEYAEVAPRRQERIRPVTKPQERTQESPQVHQRERVNVGYLFTMAVSVVAILFLSLTFLSLQSENNTNLGKVAALQSEINAVASDNNIREIEIYSNIDYDMIYTKALILGMQSADADQIVTYQRGTLEYVKQYENVPTNK